MLAALLLAALVAGVLSTIVLLSPIPLPAGRGVGVWPWSRRLLLAVIATAATDLIAGAILEGIGATRRNVAWSVIVLSACSLIWLPFTRRWSARAHLCWSATTLMFGAYLAFMLQWTVSSGLPAASEAGGLVLWVLELWASLLAAAYLWELCDTLGSEWWRRRVPRGSTVHAPDQLPFVSLHVPAHNEPPDMVIDTVTALLALDYPRYEIVVIDDNTDDEALWRPVEAFCREHQVTFEHLQDWPGYKSGALNYALRQLTDPRTELIGVVDSDYQMDRDFLRRCAPLFARDSVGFIQAPQDYREWEHDPYYRRLYHSYAYFFAVSQPSRNERNGAIFAGTMGLIRRAALEQVDGWDEWCITEDAELSLRLLRAGWEGLHVDKSFGHGVMPLTFEALKGQRFRWCFGGIQILRMHWRSMLPGTRRHGNRLSAGQRWAYFSGALQWYGDLLALLFFVFLLAGAVNIALGGGLLFRKLTGFLVAAIPLLVAIGLARAVALLRRGTGASWREALGAFMIWQSTSLVTARASVQALFAREAEFLRTPKTTEEGSLRDAFKGNPGETALALAGTTGIALALTHPSGYAGPLTAGLLLWPTISYAAAPVNSFAARRAALPPQLRAWRRTEFLRGRGTRVTVAAGGLAAAAGVAAGVLALLAPDLGPVQPPHVIGPARGRPTHSAQPSPRPAKSPPPTPTQSPGAAPTSAPTSAPAASPSPSTQTVPSPTGGPSPTPGQVTPSSRPSSPAPTPAPTTPTGSTPPTTP